MNSQWNVSMFEKNKNLCCLLINAFGIIPATHWDIILKASTIVEWKNIALVLCWESLPVLNPSSAVPVFVNL